MTIGKLERVALREVWKHEEYDLTTWLEENPEVLNEVLDFNVVSAERETAAGDFRLDLIGETEDGRKVVIENQLERSNHDHLGKVLTYLAALEADAAVWIVKDPRAEHIKAITWLNERTDTPFYLIQLEAVRIGDSLPAPLLHKIVGPSEEASAIGEVKKEDSERHRIRHRFWTRLLDEASNVSKLHARISPSRDSWVNAGAGTSGIHWVYKVRKHETSVELSISQRDPQANLAVFDALASHREEIESAFGARLSWLRLEGKRVCRISYDIHEGGWRDEEKWPRAIQATVDAMIRLEAALGHHLRRVAG